MLMLWRQIVAKLFRRCVKSRGAGTSCIPPIGLSTHTASLNNFVKEQGCLCRVKTKTFKAGAALECRSPWVWFKSDYNDAQVYSDSAVGDWYWSTCVLTCFRDHKMGLFSLHLPTDGRKTKKKKKSILGGFTVCSRSLSHAMKLTARRRQLNQRSAISPAGGVVTCGGGIVGSPPLSASRLGNMVQSETFGFRINAFKFSSISSDH